MRPSTGLAALFAVRWGSLRSVTVTVARRGARSTLTVNLGLHAQVIMEAFRAVLAEAEAAKAKAEEDAAAAAAAAAELDDGEFDDPF